MKVKYLIDRCCLALGRPDIAEAETLTDEQRFVQATLCYCFNAVEDELSRRDFPIMVEEEMYGDGEYEYVDFAVTPAKIVSVFSRGKRVDYRLFPTYLKTQTQHAVVTYVAAVGKKDLEDDVELDVDRIGENAFVYGMAAEYCLINGRTQEAVLWENKYHAAVNAAKDTASAVMHGYTKITGRAWV